jgi:hypothetical protein
VCEARERRKMMGKSGTRKRETEKVKEVYREKEIRKERQ